MRISERGQVTIPRVNREKYGYLPHTEVSFEIQGGALVPRRAMSGERDELHVVFGKKKFGRSTDELMALLRDE